MSESAIFRTNWKRVVKEFVIKALEFLVTSRVGKNSSSPSLPCSNTLLQTYIEETKSIRNQYPDIWSNNLTNPLVVSLDFYYQVEGCHPLLVERWNFKFHPEGQPISQTVNQLNQRSSIVLRSLLVTAGILPAFQTYRGKLSYRLSMESSTGLNWPRTIRSADIKTFPKSYYKIESVFGTLSTYVEYLDPIPKPEIAQQQLGLRPRLTSYDYNESPRENPSLDSSGSEQPSSLSTIEAYPPIQGLPQLQCFNKSDSGMQSRMSMITSRCVHEHAQVGFTPLSHSICNPSDDEMEEDPFENYELAMVIETNPFVRERHFLSEDAKVACYKSNCEKASKISLYNSQVGNAGLITEQISSVQNLMRTLKDTKKRILDSV